MNQIERRSHLLFLLGIVPLYAGCDSGDEGGTDTGQSSATSSTSDSDMPSTTTAPMPTTSGEMDGGANDSMGADSTMTSGGGDDTGAGATGAAECPIDMAPPDVGEIGEDCIAFVVQANECSYNGGLSEECIEALQADCQIYENEYLEGKSEACIEAFRAYSACILGLTCRELNDYSDPPPCDEFYAPQMTECMGARSPMISKLGIRYRNQ